MKQICFTCKFWAEPSEGPRWGKLVDEIEKRLGKGENTNSVFGPKKEDAVAAHCEQIKRGVNVDDGVNIYPQAGFTCNLWEEAPKTRLDDIDDIDDIE